MLALARPPEASVFVNGRPDVAAAVGAHGLQLGSTDLGPMDARTVFPGGWVGRSVHSAREAADAIGEGADYLMLGNVYPTPSHPDRPGAGLGLVREVVAMGRPVIAIGGIDAERAVKVRDAGAYGAAAIRALWSAPDPAAAAIALLAPWVEGS
jgi:thiamine-phosphate pyrophosphorylase